MVFAFFNAFFVQNPQAAQNRIYCICQRNIFHIKMRLFFNQLYFQILLQRIHAG